MSNQIELPRDAEGREIPLDTRVLYDLNGKKVEVASYECSTWSHQWFVHFTGGGTVYAADDCLLNPPDSWEKLMDDLDRAANGKDVAECLYMYREDKKFLCTECRLFDVSSDSECSCLAYADIAARIRKLRGED